MTVSKTRVTGFLQKTLVMTAPPTFQRPATPSEKHQEGKPECFRGSWSPQEEASYVGQPPFSSSCNSLRETPGGSRAARIVGAALQPPGFSPGVSWRELQELEKWGAT
jgi:hypothetical protein